MKFIKTLKIVPLFIFLCLISCDEDDSTMENISQCGGDFAVVSTVDYLDTPSSSSGVAATDLSGDCLTVTIGASGCSGESWVATLYTTTAQAENGEINYSARVDLINEEACTAVPTRDFIFDLSNLQVSGYSSVNISIDGYNNDIVYSY